MNKNSLDPREKNTSTYEYSAASITVLGDIEAVRKRPATYIGSVDQEGLNHLLFEAIDNAVDEHRSGFCKEIEIKLEPDGWASIKDDGRGIPVDRHPLFDLPACEVVLTKLHAGGKFTRGAYDKTTGTHGVGISCTNALSASLVIDIWKNGFQYRQSFVRGKKTSELITIGPSKRSGTGIRFFPDPEIFRTSLFDTDLLIPRLEELAFLHPGLTIRFTDKRGSTPRMMTFQFETGIIGYLAQLSKDSEALHRDPLYLQHNDGQLEFELAMLFTKEYGGKFKTYVNSVATISGGTHLNGCSLALTDVLNSFATTNGFLPFNGLDRLDDEDYLEGCFALLALQMSDPDFDSMTKSRLTSVHVTDIIEKAVRTFLCEKLTTERNLFLAIVKRAIETVRIRRSIREAIEVIGIQQEKGPVLPDEVFRRQFGIRSKNWHQSAAWITDGELLAKHAAQLQSLPAKSVMLDVCCGSGIVGSSFRKKVDRIVGLDLTPEMVGLAKERLDEVHLGTIYNIPFVEASFNAVVTREVLHILQFPDRALAEIFRVLKPGGTFIYGHVLPFGYADGPWMFRIFKKKQPLIFTMFHEEDLRNIFKDTGFNQIEMVEYLLWESIDQWIDTHETTPFHRREIRKIFAEAPKEAKAVHPFKILPGGQIQDCWRWCVYAMKKT